MLIQQPFANLFKSADRGHVALVHAAAGIKQKHLGMRLILSIKRFVAPKKSIVADKLPPCFRVPKTGVEAHGRTAIGSEFGDGDADTSVFIFAEREGLIIERASNVTRLQGGLAEHTGGEVRKVRRITR